MLGRGWRGPGALIKEQERCDVVSRYTGNAICTSNVIRAAQNLIVTSGQCILLRDILRRAISGCLHTM